MAFIGDSITQSWVLPVEPDFTTINLGVSGDTTAMMLDCFRSQVIEANAMLA